MNYASILKGGYGSGRHKESSTPKVDTYRTTSGVVHRKLRSPEDTKSVTEGGASVYRTASGILHRKLK